MAQCDAKALRAIACTSGFECLDQKPLLSVIAVLFSQIVVANNPMANTNANALLQSACASGISCLTERELLIVLAQLACEILQSGGGGGSSCLLCGVGPPVAAPACDCALYYDRAGATLSAWDSTGAPHWFFLIGA